MLRRFISLTVLCCILILSMAAFVAAAEKKIVLKVNATYNLKSHANVPQVSQIAAFKEALERRLPGRVEVRIFWDEQLAKTYDAAMNGLQNGLFHLQFFPLTAMAEFTKAGIPFTNLFLVPYPHVQIVYDAFDGEIGAMITERMIQETRVRPLAFWDVGFRHFMSNRKQILSLEDFKDLKYRVQPNPVHLASFKALGANPTPIPWAELFTALQQGVVDGTENTFDNIKAARLYEVQKYLTLSGHAFEMGMYAMGEDFYQKLPADIRTAINEAMHEVTVSYRQRMAENDRVAPDFFKTKMGVAELSEAELARFREAVLPVREISREQAGAEYTDKFFKLMKQYEDAYFARIKK